MRSKANTKNVLLRHRPKESGLKQVPHDNEPQEPPRRFYLYVNECAINAAWDGIKNVDRRVSGNQIKITLPSGHGKVLSPLEPPSGALFLAAVEGTLKRLPKDHQIWLLVENEGKGQVFPQGFEGVRYHADRNTWEGKINASSAGRVGQIKIVAVVAPPTSQEFFRYYQNVGGKSNYAFEPLSRVPVECKDRTFVQAQLP